MNDFLNKGLPVAANMQPVNTLKKAFEQGNELESRKFYKPVLIGTDARDGTEDTRRLSEQGNADRLADAHRGNIHYVSGANAWLQWIDGTWKWDIDGSKIRRLAADLAKVIYREGELHLEHADHYAKWARKSSSLQVIKNSVELLKDIEGIRLPLSLIDSNGYIVGINDAKSVIDLRTGEVRDANQGDFITKSLKIDHLGSADKAERWIQFLDQVFEGDAELINWIKRWCGYLLTGSTQEQIFIFCYGKGANGKSVMGDILRYILGDYARAVSPETIAASKRQAGGATPDLADLIGARLAISSETEDETALAESLVKSLVSGDTLAVRKLYGSPVQFTPKFKLMVLGNHRPVIKGTDYGIWRRVRMIPFNRIFKPEERDPYLLDKLKNEAPHILAWMIEGCMEWQARGLADVPEVIKQATAEYQEEQDIFGKWIEDECERQPGSICLSQFLYDSYRSWCLRNGHRPMPSNAFGRKLSDEGYQKCKLNGSRAWFGLSVRDFDNQLNQKFFS
ncbi:DNA primase family protein [Methylomonas rhizoryzae]|uniref:DNA primase family protein n=1 Tax=Methylomonas rhizoryzae TaxID=2608981 RepID=UPI001231B406|nr:phage/plasmid primase, P4 family [Methylomonas rhizoryzae]